MTLFKAQTDSTILIGNAGVSTSDSESGYFCTLCFSVQENLMIPKENNSTFLDVHVTKDQLFRLCQMIDQFLTFAEHQEFLTFLDNNKMTS